jgi:cytoskeletal protein RodZ
MSDPLLRATRALKEKYADEPKAPASTRERILERTTETASRRRVSRWMLMPLAAAFVLLASWAAATGAVTRFFGDKGNEEPSQTPAQAQAPMQATQTQTPAPTQSQTQLPAPTQTATPSTPMQTPMVASVPTSASAPSIAQNPAPSASAIDDSLYATAHRAHFDTRDYAAALTAWDRYLASSPTGRFAPEAKYNRAICLLRLGRKDEAAAALEPFASGAMGGYRQSEARDLRAAITNEAADADPK